MSSSHQESTQLSSAEEAQKGESLRMTGYHAEAIECFTRAIANNDKYGWAYAHRAAARGALGDYSGALKDIAAAKEHGGSSPQWLLAEEGEIYRNRARATLATDGKTAYELMDKAIKAFSEAIEKGGKTAWVYAHRGATYAMRYWVSAYDNRRPTDNSDYENGKADLTAACEANPSYGWAYAFHAILCGLYAFGERHLDGKVLECGEAKPKPWDEAFALIGKAQMSGLDVNASLLNVMNEMFIYNGGNQKHTEKDKTDYFKMALQSASRTLMLNSEDGFARYFVADALKHLGSSEAPAAIARARAALRDIRSRTFAMEGGLLCLEGGAENYKKAREILRQMKEHRDIEALSLVSRDPAWAPVRESQEYSELFEIQEA